MPKLLNQIKDYARFKGLPVIPFCGRDVTLLPDPAAFYETILSKTSSCKKRLALSALYLGTEFREAAIVSSICDNLSRNRNLNVIITLDANRSLRQDSLSKSSLTVLSSLLNYGPTAKINLLNTSSGNFLTRVIPLPKTLLEIFSTYHAKMLVFDNDTILTGANLSNVYFESRQDRYMIIKDCELLSSYIYELLVRLGARDIPIKETIQSHNHSYVKQLAIITDQNTECDSFIVPLAQHESEGLTEKEDLLCFLDSILPSTARVHLSSGYFNPSSRLDTFRVDSVLAPSEEANGFYGGRGLLKFVPRLYSALHYEYLERHPSCQMSYYHKPGWSFHGKGIWIEEIDDLYIHLIGSSNFNCRSAKRDFESQYLILTSNKSLIDKLKKERQSLWFESESIKKLDFKERNFFYSQFANYLRSFL